MDGLKRIGITIFVIGCFFNVIGGWIEKFERERERKREEARREIYWAYVEEERERIANSPAPFIGMSEDNFRDTNWGPNFDGCVETITIAGKKRKYRQDNSGHLLFRNVELKEIQKISMILVQVLRKPL